MSQSYADLSDQQLVHKMLDTERELLAKRFAKSQDKLEDTSRLRILRREIARIHTEARRRELAEGLAKDSLITRHRGSLASGVAPAAETESVGFLQGIVDKITGNE